MIFSKQVDLRGFILPEGVRIQGSIEVTGCGRIDCVVEGNVLVSAKLVIGVKGVVNGNVKADNIIVEGKVTGDIVCENHAEIANSSHITGTVTCKTVGVSANAFIGGGINKTNTSGEKSNSFLQMPFLKSMVSTHSNKTPVPDISKTGEDGQNPSGQTWF